MQSEHSYEQQVNGSLSDAILAKPFSSLLSLDQNRPIQPAGRFRRGSLWSIDSWQRNFFASEGAEPVRFVGAEFEFDGDGSFFRQIDGVNFTGLGETKDG